MGTIMDINGRDLVDTEETKKRWKEYTEEQHRKDPNEPMATTVWSVGSFYWSQPLWGAKSSGP